MWRTGASPVRHGPRRNDKEDRGMLRLRLDAADFDGVWQTRHDRSVTSGGSWISPYEHPALETDHRRISGVLDVVVRETRPNGDHLRIVIAGGQARFEAGAGGVAPLYLTVADGVLLGSWDIAEMRASNVRLQFDPLVATRLLCRRRRCSSNTLFTGVYRMTERSTAVFDGSHVAVSYPQPHEHVLAGRQLRADADPLAYLDRAMAGLVGPIVDDHGELVGAEVSGGLDSANVVLSAARSTTAQLRSFGLLVDGDVGVEQRERRKTIIDLLGLSDATVPAAGHLPFGDPKVRSTAHPHDPDGDVYSEACDALRRVAADTGVRIVLTGFGGDEMMAPHERHGHVRPPDPPTWLGDRARQLLGDIDHKTAPVAATSLATLRAFAARNPAYLRHGLWPVAPLADPGLYELGRSLPMSWRAGKALLRRRLVLAGLDLVAARQRQESFEPVMGRALQVHGPTILARMLDHSLLIDAGLVLRAGVEQLHLDLATGRPVPPSAYDLLALEIGLQSMCEPQRVAP
jgi:asparagine synthase (glutamine-hydrolysing)